LVKKEQEEGGERIAREEEEEDEKMVREEEEREGEQLVKLEFRLLDGTNLGPRKYAMETTITTIKENILLQWPQGMSFFLSFS
jgi:hypothetical protein